MRLEMKHAVKRRTINWIQLYEAGDEILKCVLLRAQQILLKYKQESWTPRLQPVAGITQSLFISPAHPSCLPTVSSSTDLICFKWLRLGVQCSLVWSTDNLFGWLLVLITSCHGEDGTHKSQMSRCPVEMDWMEKWDCCSWSCDDTVGTAQLAAFTRKKLGNHEIISKGWELLSLCRSQGVKAEICGRAHRLKWVHKLDVGVNIIF